MRICLAMVALAAIGVFCTAAQAQSYGAASPYGGSPAYGSMSGQMGMFGRRSLGSDLTAGQRSFGGSSFGAGMSFGDPTDLASARFLRANRQPGEFIGTDVQAMQHFVGAAQTGPGAGGWQQPGGFMPSMMYPGGGGPGYRGRTQAADRDQHGGQQPAGQNQNPIRTTYRVAFDYPQPGADRLSTSLARRLAEMPAIQAQTPIQVEVRGRTAILRGAVTTEHDRGLVEQLARLEPGIEAVKNEVAVASPTPADSPPP